MKNNIYIAIQIFLFFLLSSCQDTLRKDFKNPPNQYRPMPLWHINGCLTTEGIEKQLSEAKNLSGFGGVAVLPVTAHPQVGTGILCPATEPAYLSNEYFDRYGDILTISDRLGTEVILYDDIDFPSGSAGGKLQKTFPQYTRKYLIKHDFVADGPKKIKYKYPDSIGQLMAVSAMNLDTLEILDLAESVKETTLEWEVPHGKWRVMFFYCKFNVNQLVDYMQPEAVAKCIELTYNNYAKRFVSHFGTTITKTFYDDVGFVRQDQTWTPQITEIFEKKYGRKAALYYPALFYNIGEQTIPARIAFYDIRSELMAEGYVKQVAEWSEKHGVQSMGHCPGNYMPNSVGMFGDVLKFYRHTQIPLLDCIFNYGYSRNGYKQVSSAADMYDRPVVGAEVYGAFPANMDSLILYRTVMEIMARGANFIVPHGMWYNPEKDKVRIPPLIAPQNPLLGNLHLYSDYIARSCMMLQEGRSVADIAVLWPVNSIQAEHILGETSPVHPGNRIPEYVNHHQISDILTNKLHRDFTFTHPEALYNGKITIQGAELRLNNLNNQQDYKALILPGCSVLPVHTMHTIKEYYNSGGKIIFANVLPTRSSEFDNDSEITKDVNEIFGEFPEIGDVKFVTNNNGGFATFIPEVTDNLLNQVFSQMNLVPDVSFSDTTFHNSGNGCFNYIHKYRDGKDIFFFTNSTDDHISTDVILRGVFKPELWNPHTGSIQKISEYEIIHKNNVQYTKFALTLPEVSSVFIVAGK
jgi:hypothetical protein